MYENVTIERIVMMAAMNRVAVSRNSFFFIHFIYILKKYYSYFDFMEEIQILHFIIFTFRMLNAKFNQNAHSKNVMVNANEQESDKNVYNENGKN